MKKKGAITKNFFFQTSSIFNLLNISTHVIHLIFKRLLNNTGSVSKTSNGGKKTQIRSLTLEIFKLIKDSSSNSI